MLRIIDTVERNVVDTGIAAITVPDSQSTMVVPDTRNQPDELAYIQLFNAGDNKAYLAFGRDCDNVANFNCFLFPGASIDVKHRLAIYCYSPGGTQIGVTMLRRTTALTNNT